jgi:hypothetical protein
MQRYATSGAAMDGIAQSTLAIYEELHPETLAERRDEIEDAIAVMQDIHRMNVFPQMEIHWNTYPSLIGHGDTVSARCFRCHDGAMRDQDGMQITIDCDACHYVLARDSTDPQILKVLGGRPAFYKGPQD